MQERVFRYGLTGLVFILSILFGFWYLGGNIRELIIVDKAIVSTTIITIVSSPALGFLLSSIYIQLWKLINKKESIYLDPQRDISDDYYRVIYDRFKESSGLSINEKSYQIKDRSTLCLNHQILIREKQNKDAIDFSSRRLDVFYAHLNIAFSIFAGMLFGFILGLFEGALNKCFSLKGFWILPIIYYLFFVARKQAIEALKESNDFEKRFITFSNINK